MDHFLSKKEKPDEIDVVELDVSFLLKYLNKLYNGLPLEIMLLKYYKMRTDATKNTLMEFRQYIKHKLAVSNDVELFSKVNKNTYIKLTVKIKQTIDALINREFGCEVYDAKFMDYVIANNEKIVIKIEIKK